MKDAVIFDLDGTLWDPTDRSSEVWNRVLEKYSEVSITMTPQKVSKLLGKTMEEIGQVLFPDLNQAQQKSIVDDFGCEEVEFLYENGAVLYDGIEETLEKLSSQYDLCIVSNSQDGYVPAFLHAHKLNKYFKDIEMSGRTGLDKGSNIKLIIERNSIKHAVYVGDTDGDEKAARKAGVPFIWAKYGFGKAVSPDSIIDSISELPEVLSEMR